MEGTNRTFALGPRRNEQGPHKRLTRLACECPGVSSRGVGRWWPAAGLGALSAAVHAWDLLKEVAINPTIEPSELTQDWGNTLGGHKQSLLHTRSQKKGAETESDLPVSV